MSEVTVFSNEMPAYIAKENDELSKNLIVSGGDSYPNIISIKGAKFTPSVEGAALPAQDELAAIILTAMPESGTMKAYYDQPFREGEILQPRCTSKDGVTPNCADPISNSCIDCKFNQFGSAPNGKAKACTDRKHLYVMAANNLDGKAIFRIAVPPTSFKNLSAAGSLVASHKAPLHSVIFKLSFDRTATYPKIKFDPAGFLSEEDFRKVQEIYANFDFSSEVMRAPSDLPAKPVEPIKIVKTETKKAVTADDAVAIWSKKGGRKDG